jgi:hypothetical protein
MSYCREDPRTVRIDVSLTGGRLSRQQRGIVYSDFFNAAKHR